MVLSGRSADDDSELDAAETDEGSPTDDDGSYRLIPFVRNVRGETKQETRASIALAFSSPLFQELLARSCLAGEGV